jgi:hypothetical protein
MLIEPVHDSLDNAEVSFNGITHNIANGVFVGSELEDLYAIKELVQKAHLLTKESNQILIQEMYFGSEYRVFMAENEIVAVAKKQPATLIGDGHSSISLLIEHFNQFYLNYKNDQLHDSANNFNITPDELHHNFFHKPQIISNKELIEQLNQLGYNLESVLDKNEKLTLPFADLYGASWIDQTDVFPKEIAEKLAKVNQYIGMKMNSVDVLITENGDFKIINCSCYPSIMTHHFITYGLPQPVVQKIFNYLFKIQP